MTQTLIRPTRSRLQHPRVAGMAILIVLAAVVAFGSWYAGSAMAPTSTDAERERVDAAALTAETARAEALETAYVDAYQRAYAAGVTSGAREGELAGVAAGRAATQ